MDKAPRDLLLYSGENLVMRLNFSTGVYDIIREVLVPWPMKDKFRSLPDLSNYSEKGSLTQSIIVAKHNCDVFTSWLSSRTLSLSRQNAKWLYNLIKVEQLDDPISKQNYL